MCRSGQRPWVVRLWLSPLVALCLTTSACGSTVQPQSMGTPALNSVAPNTVTTNGSTGAAVTPSTNAPGKVPVSPSKPGTTHPTATSITGSGSATPGGHHPTAARTSPTSAGPTSSAGPIEVGIGYVDRNAATALASSVGYTLNPGNPYADARALVSWVNHHGGFGGHQIEPVYFKQSLNLPADVTEQSACQTWTQDHHVKAVIWPDNFSPDALLVSCLARAGVIITGGGDTYLNSPQLQAANGYLQTPYMFAGDRMYRDLIERLVAIKWFTPGGKIGVLSTDGPTYAADVGVVEQTLAHYGLKVDRQVSLSASSIGEDASECTSAELRFATDHVTNIVVVDDGARAFIYCTPVFRLQGYHPKMSITSYDSPSTLQSIIGGLLQGSAGIGWEPVNDEGQSAKLSAAAKLCVSVMRSAADDVTRGALMESIALGYCDGFFFLKRAYADASDTTPAAVQAAIAALGTTYESPLAISTRFGPDRFDGAGSVADLSYQTACKCFRYEGKLTPTE